MSEKPTPRTDAQDLWHGEPAVHISFARSLERELAAMRERAEGAERERDAMRAALRTIRDYEIDWRIDVAPNVENLRAIAENALGEEAIEL